ncbi:MAG TPA: CHASE2 domain-containing protein [Dyella sp.]|uniref:CHASE2 domain-containing protein n=1 Tax=Dyella sp. TaxID=1869338 RepID=UPI002F94DABE
MAAGLLLVAGGATMRLDNLLYDTHMRHWSYAPGDNVLIVAIDPQSLTALGNWPWPRATHAELVKKLAAAGVRGIGIDVTMAEPDARHPENDRAFAAAIGSAGNVVLPVFAEATELGGVLEEMLPPPVIASEAAAFGHVDASKDPDGVARGAYLKAGLGRPQWPSLALALYNLRNPSPLQTLPGLHRPNETVDSPYQWLRDDYVLLRFAGASGSFNQVSYIDVLDGHISADQLKGRWVLIGATAEGLGDQLQTAASVANQPMPGVEYQANILESLRDGRLITPLNLRGQLLFGALSLAVPLLLWGLPGIRRTWVLAVPTLAAPLLLSLALLRGAGWWWPPGAFFTVALLGLLAHGGVGALVRRHGVPNRPDVDEPWRALEVSDQ